MSANKGRLVSLIMIFILLFSFSSVTSAASLSELIGSDAVGTSGTVDDTKIQSDIADIVKKVKMIGAAVAFVMLVIAGISFSTSGKNETRRAGAFASLIGVAVGLYIIFQAGGIASWFAGFGS